jgi:predicted Zn-dependent peptidase
LKFRSAFVLVAAFAASCGKDAAPKTPPAPSPAPASGPSEKPAPAAKRAADPFAPAVPGDPMGVIVKKLPNGFTVMVCENHEEPRAECWITTRAGSAKDPADATGLAHYLEHMNFKGTTHLGTVDWEKEKPHLDRITQLYDELFDTKDEAKRAELYKAIDAENVAASAFEVASEIDNLYQSMGFKGLNAFTNNDQTSYTVNVPANRLDTWAQVECERFSNPVYRIFQTELEAVYEEKNRGMDNKAWAVQEALLLGVFPDHPYGTQTTIGTVEHLKNPSLTKIYDYFHKWYVPGNMVIVVSGDFKAADAFATIEKRFGAFPSKPVPPDPVHPMAPLKGVKRIELKFEAEEEVEIAWRTVRPDHPDADALKIADMMLANGHTGLIDVNVNQKQLLQSATAGPEWLVEAGGELVQGVAKNGQPLEDAEKILLEQVALLKQGAFTEEDMKSALTEFEIGEKQKLESNRARVQAMTEAFIHAQPWDWKVHEIDRMRKVTKADVVAAANKYFGGDYVVVYRRTGKPELPKITKPGFTPVKIKQDKHSAFYEKMAAEPAAPIEPRFLEKDRDYFTKDLASGKLVWAKNPANDLFQLSFTIDVGTDTDPRLGLGLSLLDFGGAGDLDQQAFKRKLYALGTQIGAGAGRQETSISISGLDANLEESVRLVREHFAKPTGASQGDLDKLVERIIGARAKQKIDARAIGGALSAFAQRGEDSDVLRQPKNEELKAFKADDLLASARDAWNWKRSAQYVGTRPIDEVAALVDLPPIDGAAASAKAPPPRKAIQIVVPAKPRVLLVDKKAAQAQVGMFYPDGNYDRAAVPVHRVYNEYMSGSMGAVVFQEIRESRALAYDAGTVYRDAAWKDDSNVFMGILGTQADKTLDALEVLMRIVKEMPAAQARMDNAKRSIDETYRATRIPFRTIPSTVVSWWRQGLEGDPRPWNWEQAKKMTLVDLSAFAARWKTAPYTITIVGDKSRFDMAKLAQFGEVVEMTPDQLFAW